MKRLNAKQLLVLPKGKYHDGNGLYISISSKGKGKWSFRYRAHKKSREMGLGRFPDVSLFDARQHALSNKQLNAFFKKPDCDCTENCEKICRTACYLK